MSMAGGCLMIHSSAACRLTEDLFMGSPSGQVVEGFPGVGDVAGALAAGGDSDAGIE